MNGGGPLTPHAWVGTAPFPWPAAHTLKHDDVIRACFCIVDLSLARTRQDQPYLRLTLTDRFGPVEGRVWDGALEAAAALRPGLYIGVAARAEFFNGALQLCIDEFAPVHVQLEELELFLPRSRRPDAELAAELDAAIASVADPALRGLLERLLGAGSELRDGFRLAPAAKHNHHAYLGGLLEHTLSVTRVCDFLAAHYGQALDRDLLITAAILHDIGKIREIGARPGFPYTDEGKLLGHILLGLQMVHDAAADVPDLTPARLLLLEHLIAAHQGRFEWQSPREPAILEGFVLHYADDLDAKLQQVSNAVDRVEGGWTPWERAFRREFLAHRPPDPAHPPGHAPPDDSTGVPGHETAAAAPRPEDAAPPPRRGKAAAPQPDAPEVRPPRPAASPPSGGGGANGPPEDEAANGRWADDTLDLFGEGRA